MDIKQMPLSELAAELKSDPVGMDFGVAILQGCKSIRLVAARILVIADPNKRRFKQMHDGREHLFTRQAAAGEIARDTPANLRQGTGESDCSPILGFVADFSPIRVIPILLTSAGIASRCLEMTIEVRAYPNILLRRRNRQTLNPLKDLETSNPFAAGVKIVKGALVKSPYDARLSVGHIAKPSIVC